MYAVLFVNIQNESTALMKAAENGRAEAVRVLIAEKADKNETNDVNNRIHYLILNYSRIFLHSLNLLL